MSVSIPDKIPVPWATGGLKNTIPAASNPLTGLAGYDQGFTAINMTPKTAGGIPPFGQDFNGIFFAVTEALRYLETGALFPYDGAFATTVGGYPLGALLQRTDGYGLWRNTSADNTTDPEAFGAGWAPEGSGITSVAMSNVNVTLTALQAARNIVIITGALVADLNLVLPTYQRQWTVVNRATGIFSVTVKTASGSGVAIPSGSASVVYGDGIDIRTSLPGTAIPPAGIPLDWAGLTPPSWAVVRNGSALSRATYAALFSALCPTRSGTLTNGTNTVSGLSSTLDMWVGMPVEGVGVPAGTTIASIPSASAITLSANATVSGAQALTLFPFGYGAGGSATTFGVPDDRGLHVRAYDSGRGYEQSTLTASTTSGSNVLAGIASTRGLYVGMSISGAGIPGSTTISEIVSAVSVKLSANATATASGIALTVTGRQVGAEGTDEVKTHNHVSGYPTQSGSPTAFNPYGVSTAPSQGVYLAGSAGASQYPFTSSTGGPENNVKRRIYLPIITLGA